MEFCLHYYGKLKSRDNATGKHAIRQTLHHQIHSLCMSDPFENAFKQDLDGTRSDKDKPMYVEHDGKRYWFLISEYLATVVDVNITILVPHDLGRMVQNGGDIDNRIKTLFDALRVPAVASEIPASDAFEYGTSGMYCLLQDDKLINRVSIRSYRDHAPIDGDSVRCLIEVETKITKALWGNLNFV
jgi:Endodeoxyribonuclease RusA.